MSKLLQQCEEFTLKFPEGMIIPIVSSYLGKYRFNYRLMLAQTSFWKEQEIKKPKRFFTKKVEDYEVVYWFDERRVLFLHIAVNGLIETLKTEDYTDVSEAMKGLGLLKDKLIIGDECFKRENLKFPIWLQSNEMLSYFLAQLHLYDVENAKW